VVCSVCGGKDLPDDLPEMVAEIIEMEGGGARRHYDGRKLTWTRDAKRGLWTIHDGYKRRRTKARIEKAARLRHLASVTMEFAKVMIEEETGTPLVLPADGPEAEAPVETQDGKKLVARDEKRNPLLSEFAWTDEAAKRVLRVPAGSCATARRAGSGHGARAEDRRDRPRPRRGGIEQRAEGDGGDDRRLPGEPGGRPRAGDEGGDTSAATTARSFP